MHLQEPGTARMEPISMGPSQIGPTSSIRGRKFWHRVYENLPRWRAMFCNSSDPISSEQTGALPGSSTSFIPSRSPWNPALGEGADTSRCRAN